MNILLNINNFSQEFAYYKLRRIIKPYMKILIIPLSYHEDWIHDDKEFKEHYSKGSPEFEDIAKEFYCYGIKRKNIKILNYYSDNKNTIKNKFKFADILFFTGGYPDKMLYRIDSLGIRKNILEFKGIIMGTSAGAMIQFDHYHVTPEEDGQDYEYHDGLGLISGFDIEVHFENDFIHLASIITALKQTEIPIYCMPNNGGLIYNKGKITCLGDTFLVKEEDVEEIQEEIDSMRI